jgi:hypothetical protein
LTTSTSTPLTLPDHHAAERAGHRLAVKPRNRGVPARNATAGGAMMGRTKSGYAEEGNDGITP